MKKRLAIYFCLSIGLGNSSVYAQAANHLKDFKATDQKIALVGVFNEYVERSAEEVLVEDLRGLIGKYSETADKDEIEDYEMGENPSNLYFKPVDGEAVVEKQKEFLKATAEKNSVDIFVLGSIRESSEGVELQLQLYDVRIDTLSEIKEADVHLRQRKEILEKLVHELLNYLDRDGFVHPTSQDFLGPYQANRRLPQAFIPPDEEDFSLNPGALGAGTLAGSPTVGGEKTPFWERWWFWTIVGGTLVTAGSLSYYFLVLNQPPKQADLEFEFSAVGQ